SAACLRPSQVAPVSRATRAAAPSPNQERLAKNAAVAEALPLMNAALGPTKKRATKQTRPKRPKAIVPGPISGGCTRPLLVSMALRTARERQTKVSAKLAATAAAKMPASAACEI